MFGAFGPSAGLCQVVGQLIFAESNGKDQNEIGMHSDII